LLALKGRIQFSLFTWLRNDGEEECQQARKDAQGAPSGLAIKLPWERSPCAGHLCVA